jgi:hypothetical protein
MKDLIYLSFCLLILSIAFLIPTNSDAVITSPDYRSCVKVFDAGRQMNDQRAIRLYNGCGERLFINVCVIDDQGNPKLYQSGRTVPANGNFNLYTFPGVIPQNLAYTASTSPGSIPGNCPPPKG